MRERTLSEIRRDAEADMARRLNPHFAGSAWGHRMIDLAGQMAVDRTLADRRRPLVRRFGGVSP